MFGGNGVNKQNANTEKRAIFVGNLPFTVTNDGLKMLAESNGVSPEAIMSARIATKFNTGRSRGFGYLEFSSESVASQNLEKMKASGGKAGIRIEDRVLKLDLDHGIDGPNKGRRTARTSADYSLFLGNLDFALDNLVAEDFVKDMIAERVELQANVLKNSEQLRLNKLRNRGLSETEQNEEAGAAALADDLAALQSFLSTPIRVKIAHDATSGRSRGFGRVFFDSECSRDFALDALQMSELNGREVTVAVTQKRDGPHDKAPPRERKRDYSSNSIFVGNLAFDTSADDIADIITDILGPSRITSVRLARDPYTGRAKGYGHVDLKSGADCERAVDMMSGMTLLGRNIRVDFASNNASHKEVSSKGGRHARP